MFREDSTEWGIDHVLHDQGTGTLAVGGIRTGPQDGFDRVVIDVNGHGAPGWYISYTDEPTYDGSGVRAEIAGDTFIDLFISPTVYPMDSEVDTYSGPVLLDGDGTAAVSQVRFVGNWEGGTQVIIGLDGAERRPFRIFALEDPLRVVVDIATT